MLNTSFPSDVTLYGNILCESWLLMGLHVKSTELIMRPADTAKYVFTFIDTYS
jgi:hypothetical protein